MADLLALLWIPFLMCLVLTGIHAYLGVHVLAREVVFVDIALAQIAALGATAAFLFGYELETWESYVSGLTATLLGALVLSLTRTQHRHVSQEAIIGIVYAVSSEVDVLLAVHATQGAQHVYALYVGTIPTCAGSVHVRSLVTRLLSGVGFGTLVSILGMVASAALDLPTGATVVCTFGLTLLVFAIIAWLFGWRPASGAAVMAPAAPLAAKSSP